MTSIAEAVAAQWQADEAQKQAGTVGSRAYVDLIDFIADVIMKHSGRQNGRLARVLAEKIVLREMDR